MPLFQKISEYVEPEVSIPNKNECMKIYNYLKNCLDESMIFIEEGIPTDFSARVRNEALRLESEILNFMYTEDKIPKNPNRLIERLSSDYLDIEQVFVDVIIYNPTYSEERTWEEFREYYKKLKEKQV